MKKLIIFYALLALLSGCTTSKVVMNRYITNIDMNKNELERGGKLLLLNPEKYKGYACHPTEDRTIRQVISATITRATDMNHWYDIEIVFEGDHVFESSSATIGGCKRIFAFQCSAGSKWENG